MWLCHLHHLVKWQGKERKTEQPKQLDLGYVNILYLKIYKFILLGMVKKICKIWKKLKLLTLGVDH